MDIPFYDFHPIIRFLILELTWATVEKHVKTKKVFFVDSVINLAKKEFECIYLTCWTSKCDHVLKI